MTSDLICDASVARWFPVKWSIVSKSIDQESEGDCVITTAPAGRMGDSMQPILRRPYPGGELGGGGRLEESSNARLSSPSSPPSPGNITRSGGGGASPSTMSGM